MKYLTIFFKNSVGRTLKQKIPFFCSFLQTKRINNNFLFTLGAKFDYSITLSLVDRPVHIICKNKHYLFIFLIHIAYNITFRQL